MRAVFYYRVCNNCCKPYLYKDVFGKNGGGALDRDDKYCPLCTDSYMHNQFKMPPELYSLKRLHIAGRRLIKLDFSYHDIELLKEIAKRKNHESHSSAQLTLRYIAKAKKGSYRSAISQANI